MTSILSKPRIKLAGFGIWKCFGVIKDRLLARYGRDPSEAYLAWLQGKA